MNPVTIYLYDNKNIYSGNIQHNPKSPLPKNGTDVVPAEGMNFWDGITWTLKDPETAQIVTPAVTIRIITKVAFRQRLKPFWADYRQAKLDESNNAIDGFNGKVADAIDYILDQFSDFSSINLDDPLIVNSINDLVANMLITTPGSTVTSVVLLVDGTKEEAP